MLNEEAEMYRFDLLTYSYVISSWLALCSKLLGSSDSISSGLSQPKLGANMRSSTSSVAIGNDCIQGPTISRNPITKRTPPRCWLSSLYKPFSCRSKVKSEFSSLGAIRGYDTKRNGCESLSKNLINHGIMESVWCHRCTTSDWEQGMTIAVEAVGPELYGFWSWTTSNPTPSESACRDSLT